MATTQMTLQEWEDEGTRLFGPDKMAWRFKCPCCGHVATPADWEKAGAKENAVAFSCVGRWQGAKREAFGEGEGPCNYAGGGLFRLNPVIVTAPDGKTQSVFAFAEPAEVAP